MGAASNWLAQLLCVSASAWPLVPERRQRVASTTHSHMLEGFMKGLDMHTMIMELAAGASQMQVGNEVYARILRRRRHELDFILSINMLLTSRLECRDTSQLLFPLSMVCTSTIGGRPYRLRRASQ